MWNHTITRGQDPVLTMGKTFVFILDKGLSITLKLELSAGHHSCYFNLPYVYRRLPDCV